MNPSFIQQMINHKINQITPDELVKLARDYNINVTKQEAQNVLSIVKSEKINISDQRQIKRLLSKIEQEVSSRARRQIHQLLNQFLDKLN